MFCEPKGQKLDIFICRIFLWIFWHPWDLWGCFHIDLKKKKGLIWLCANLIWCIYAKSQGHFKYIKKHKITHRNCCSGVITLCSSKFFLVILCPCSTVIVGVSINNMTALILSSLSFLLELICKLFCNDNNSRYDHNQWCRFWGCPQILA